MTALIDGRKIKILGTMFAGHFYLVLPTQMNMSMTRQINLFLQKASYNQLIVFFGSRIVESMMI